MMFWIQAVPRCIAASLAWGATATVSLSAQAATQAESFDRRIAPVRAANCLECHSGGKAKGQLDLSRRATALRGGESGPPVVPGKPAESLLIKKLKGTGGGQRMPARADPLPGKVIAMIEKWIEEGVRFDAPSASQPMQEVAALARAMRSTHEELSGEREKIAMRNWKLGMPGVEVATRKTKNFLIVGNYSENTLVEYGVVAEQTAGKVAVVLKTPADQPVVKGRMTLFFFNQRYDYSEFGKMVEKRDLPRAWRGHWRFSIVDAYGAMIPPRAGEYQLGPLVGQQLCPHHLAQRTFGTALAKYFQGHALAYISLATAIDNQRFRGPTEHVNKTGSDGETGGIDNRAGIGCEITDGDDAIAHDGDVRLVGLTTIAVVNSPTCNHQVVSRSVGGAAGI